MKHVMRIVMTAMAAATLAAAACAQDAWTHKGRTSARNSLIAGTAPSIVTPRFVTTDSRTLVGQSMPAVADHRIFVYALNADGDGNEVLAFSEIDGHLLWARAVGTAQYDSRSSPTVDTARGHVLMASGTKVTAMRADDGVIVWETTLGTLPVVNGTACVCGDTAYVATYSPLVAGAKMYAINLNPDHATLEAGDVITSASLNKSLGSEAAYDADLNRLFVTDYDGYLRRWTTDCSQDWAFSVPGAGSFTPTYGSFTGGAVVSGDCVYAATYNFYGSTDNSRLYCINKTTGSQVWAAAAERTASTPIVTDTMVLLSGGLAGYGSAAKMEAYDKTSGTKLWQWTTAGRWTTQPVVVGTTLFVGANSTSSEFSACTDLYAVNLSLSPEDDGFVVGHYEGAGSSPAYANGNIYTIGAAGLYAFGPAIGGETGGAVTAWESVVTHGSAGSVALALSADAVEPRLPGLQVLRLTFDEALNPATVTSAALVIVGETSGTVSTSGATAVLSEGDTVLEFTLASPLADADRYAVTVGDAVRTVSGEAVSQNAALSVAALAGDVDGSGAVTAADVLAARGQGGLSAGGAPRADVNASGVVTGTDLLAIRGRIGNALP